MESGYYNTMLKRYFFSGAYFSNEKKVLDSCCGLGWGTYIVSQYAKTVDAFDIDERAISFCRDNWNSINIKWFVNDVFNLCDVDNDYDVALAMETIEHFSKSDGEKYIKELSTKVRKGGFLIGTSAFPDTQEQAKAICVTNPFHLYIFTQKEMNDILNKYFSKHHIINKWLFIAQK